MGTKEVDCCAECGETKEEHGHEFVPMFVPSSCTCEPGSWGNPLAIPKICDAFVNDTEHLGEEYCLNCEHNESCHAQRAGREVARAAQDSSTPEPPR